MRAPVLLLALAAAGCSSARPTAAPTAPAAPAVAIAPAPAPPAPVPVVPAALLGTWSSDDGTAFLAIGEAEVVLNLPGLPRRAGRVASVAAVGAAAALTLDDGAALVVCAGRATAQRTLGATALMAERAVLDVAVPEGTTLRLWGDGPTTWLPLPAAPAAPARTGDPAEDSLLAAAAAEPLLGIAVRDLLRRARAGASAAELDGLWCEHARRVRLAALERLAAPGSGPSEPALAEVDALTSALATCAEAYAAWRAGRG